MVAVVHSGRVLGDPAWFGALGGWLVYTCRRGPSGTGVTGGLLVAGGLFGARADVFSGGNGGVHVTGWAGDEYPF